jgi:hypothetical protein
VEACRLTRAIGDHRAPLAVLQHPRLVMLGNAVSHDSQM